MRFVYGSTAMAIAALTVWMTAPAAAHQNEPAMKRGNGGTSITLAGCIQREGEYRRATGSGTGGVGGFGVGLGNEFVVINAMRIGTSPTPGARKGSTVNDLAAAESPCGASGGGEAFELTGPLERELGRFVGHRVEIVGVLKPGKDAPVGTSGTETRTDTTGLNKLNPWDQDLQLQEVEVTSFREPSR
jgi:hypothetical protein